MKEFMWKSVTWVVKRHGDILQFKSASTRWRTVANFIDNPHLNPQFRRLLTSVAFELELTTLETSI